MAKNHGGKTEDKTLRTLGQKNVVGHGVDTLERRIDALRRVVERVKATTYWMLSYDIPTDRESDCPNPSGLLWNYGFRFNKSVWVLSQESIESRAVQELLEHWKKFPDVEADVWEYSERSMERIRAKAEQRLDEELRRIHTSLITRLASADDRYQKAEEDWAKRLEGGEEITDQEQRKAADRRDNHLRVAITESAEALRAAVHCAELFDDHGKLCDLLEGVRKAINAEALAFNASMRLRRITARSKLAPEV